MKSPGYAHRCVSTILGLSLVGLAVLNAPSISAQTYTFTQLSTSPTAPPSTDGTNVVFVDSSGIEIVPFGGGTKTTLVAAGATLPNGLGVATSFTNYGPPVLQNGVVYFGATSSTGEGYYSVAANVANGPITKIIDSTTTYSGKPVQATTFPAELAPSVYLNGTPLTPPSVASNLFVPTAGGAIFSANLSPTSSTTDNAVLSLSSGGALSTVIDSNSLSGCSNISNFATDGNIYAVWVLSGSNHVQLLENNSPSLSCSNVLLDLGVMGTSATGILPGQLSSGSIMPQFFAASTVIDSGYIYFSASMELTSTATNAGGYSGIFRIQPGGSLQAVITTNTSLGSPGSVDNSITAPLWMCSSFAVHGNYVVFGTCLESHYGFSAGLAVEKYFYYNQSTTALQLIAQAGTALASNDMFYSYNYGAPTQAGLSSAGKFAFAVDTYSVVSGGSYQPTGLQLFTVNLLSIPQPTSTAVTVTPTTPIYGTAGTIKATVTPTGSSTPTGTVTIQDTTSYAGTVTLGSGSLSSGSVTITANLVNGGNNTVSASYAGDAYNAASNGSTTVSVNTATPTVTVGASPVSTTFGSPVTLTGTATGVTGGAVPTGVFTYDNGITVVGNSGINASGTGSTAITTLPVGVNSITANYTGNLNYGTASSSPVTVTISALSTSTTVTGPSTAAAGTPVTFTATVTSPQGGTPTGTVNFFNGSTMLGSGTLSSGSTTVTTSLLPIGVDSITAAYTGSTLYPASTSTAASITITGTPSFTVASGTQSLTIVQGQSGSATISITPVGGFGNPITFACTGLPQYATCTFAPSSVTPGVAVVTTTVTVSTNVQMAAVQTAPAPIWLAGVGLLGLLAFGRRRLRKRFAGLTVIVFLGALTAGLTACSELSSSMPAAITPTGTSNVSVTATSGTVVQTLPISITIAP